MSKYKIGKIVKGYVSGIEAYGAFVVLDEYYNGLIHISEISHNFVRDIKDFLNIGDSIYVKVIDVNEEMNQVRLSIKDINYKINNRYKRKTIKETSLGFNTLRYKLPLWINEKVTKIEKKE